ncbi:uncharacterized protein F4812DRAFT_470067 [Daldinia caldariorum]|uniref:uncharacterized protein n=1 Tax=Daldinia caldariorum TaxID=326644 RepID=UPI00200761E0|nr:uncharacterized protein F4812DRAFT_470067 [Daldinia caldariorum]KAI1470078.1 hypothetical protein F4812DRAFT_470067 [Daldinia caldariorum]
MPSISPLPESTARLLCSPLAITTPVALVKELVDNAIDAKATSIEVVISTDTVKRIEVRDNGIGIHPDDHDVLGRRGHTSKLRSFEELRTQFGKTLGFRGEALASANSLAQVTVTTKYASEPVAAILHIKPGTGGILKQQPASAPIGTTVSIAELFHQLPVREQVAIKNSSKTIDKIRELLRSYAMARPKLRYSLRVLQAPKQNWTFSSNPSFSVKEAAVQLFGPEITTYCFEKTLEISGLTDSNDASVKQQGDLPNCKYVFEAFILKKDSRPSKCSKQRYFSVDGRPVTAKRGTLKKLLDIYVEHIGVLSSQGTSTARPKEYFIRLNIKCPPGSYDANIEASKDDVVFSDEKTILDGFKDLCKEVYRVSPPSRLHSQSPTEQNSFPASSDNPGARKPLPRKSGVKSSLNEPHCLSPSAQTTDQPIIQPIPQRHQSPITSQSRSTQLQDADQHSQSPGSTGVQSRGHQSPNAGLTQCRVDMSTDFNEYSYDRLQKTSSRPPQASHIIHEKPDVTITSAPRDVNPWIISKMNAPNRSRTVGKQLRNEPTQRYSSPPSEFESVMTPEPPILRHTGAAPRDLDVPPSQRYLEPQSPLSQLQPKVPGGPYRSPISSPSGVTPRNTMGNTAIPSTIKPRRHRNTLPWSPPSSIEAPVISKNRLSTTSNEPIADNTKQTTISFPSAGRNRKRQLQDDSIPNYQSSQGPEDQREDWFQYIPILAKDNSSYNFSLQKMPHVLEQRQRQICVNPKATEDQPRVELRNIGLEDGANSSEVVEPIRTTLASDDPRAYLLRRQKSMTIEGTDTKPKKLRRLNSSLLPLENIPLNEQTHFLAVVEVWNTDTLRVYVRKYATYDGYITKGFVKNGIEMSLDEGRNVEKRLKSFFLRQPGVADGEEVVPEINICSLLKGKGVKTTCL